MLGSLLFNWSSVRIAAVVLVLCVSASMAPTAPAIADRLMVVVERMVHVLTDPVIPLEDNSGADGR